MKVPLKQYMTAKKIALAKTRLQEGDNVTDTAFACGFFTVSHFIVVFRRVTGMTPGEYRNRVRES
jgi:AraC-like DNA-binding protein